jgi:hypothetical protein
MADMRLARWSLPVVVALLATGCSCMRYCGGATGLLPPVSLSERELAGPRLASLQTAQAAPAPGRVEAQPAHAYAPAFGDAGDRRRHGGAARDDGALA